MGTNYYAVKKKALKLENQIDDLLEKINNDEIKGSIKNIFLNKYDGVIKLLDEGKQEIYMDQLDESINSFINHIKYGVNDIFDINEDTKIHIGKSSAGWLFNFQDQNNDECKWHSYEEVMNWLKQNTIGDNASYIIVDEYNRVNTFEELKDLIDTKQKDPRNIQNPDNFTYCRNVNGYRFSSGQFS